MIRSLPTKRNGSTVCEVSLEEHAASSSTPVTAPTPIERMTCARMAQAMTASKLREHPFPSDIRPAANLEEFSTRTIWVRIQCIVSFR